MYPDPDRDPWSAELWSVDGRDTTLDDQTPSFGLLHKLKPNCILKIFEYVYEKVNDLDLEKVIKKAGITSPVTAIVDIGCNDSPLFVSKQFHCASLRAMKTMTAPIRGTIDDNIFHLMLKAEGASYPFFTIHISGTCLNRISWDAAAHVHLLYNRGCTISFAAISETSVKHTPKARRPMEITGYHKALLVLPSYRLFNAYYVINHGHTISIGVWDDAPAFCHLLDAANREPKPQGCLCPDHCDCHYGVLSTQKIVLRADWKTSPYLWTPDVDEMVHKPVWHDNGFCSESWLFGSL
ncbi:uncharacterized protein L3040_006692 [Drepanopeziza brunnea f. sp. 'multigermtubi']|uniref:uncharacterized protein n=1 Tax=Drepanopeziza brunnea f. sp. 'multigermtubi' TaxID=698441 RepID=UPI002395841A|nr:hypothetical protein L3040_006692 [Drepanopeziza brunnea f. sp. 'multigermtubi']